MPTGQAPRGPSATAYFDRDGTIVRALDPVKYAAWSQDDVASPNACWHGRLGRSRHRCRLAYCPAIP